MRVCCKSFCRVTLTRKSFWVETTLCSNWLPFLIGEWNTWCQHNDVWSNHAFNLAYLHMDTTGPSKCELQRYALFMPTVSPSFKCYTPIGPKAQHSEVNKSLTEYPVQIWNVKKQQPWVARSIFQILLEFLHRYITCHLSEVQFYALSYKAPACSFKPFWPGFLPPSQITYYALWTGRFISIGFLSPFMIAWLHNFTPNVTHLTFSSLCYNCLKCI